MEKSEQNLIHSLDYGERVTSNYAEIYFDDDYCEYKPSVEEPADVKAAHEVKPRDEWISPSDELLTGRIDLIPPFTSKISRGTAHKGILEIGDGVLQKERDKFLKHLAQLLADNDSAWTHIQEQEKVIIAQKVKAIYEKIFLRKSTTMKKEMLTFYEDTLRSLEKHVRTEVRSVLISAHCSMISDLNQQITEKLQKEKQILEKALRKKYEGEIRKLKRYYLLLLHNEKHRSSRIIKQTIIERNQALRIFSKQIETDSATSTMYVMCTERKKCRMRQFLLENYHTKEIKEKLKTIKDKQEILDEFYKGKKQITEINKEWKEKVKKILQLFLKFISYSLKLLPEQTTFLLDLEQLVVLQLNEIQKHPTQAANILINEKDVKNIFKFHEPEKKESICEAEPFVIEGDLSPSIPTPYGSTETLPSHVDLPYFRLQRQFIYAKCQKIDQVRDYLESLRCKCRDFPKQEPAEVTPSPSSTPVKTPTPPVSEKSSDELFMVDDINRLQECPKRGCHSILNRLSFPNLDDYLDFDEEKYLRVETILGNPAKLEAPPELIDPREILRRDLVFSATTEPRHTVETQYSSQEDLGHLNLTCPCMSDSQIDKKMTDEAPDKKEVDIGYLLAQRKESLKRMMHENPKLLKLFSEESFDFIY